MMHSQQELLKIFESYRAKHSFNAEPKELYEPIEYILGLGGKRIRPLLTLMGCDLFRGNINEALPPACAVELFHNFTLVHDDIMDNASLRRNQPTVHQKYSSAQAILSGDVMLIYAYEFLNQLKAEKFRRAIDVFNTTAIRVCEGQQYDLNFPSASEVSVKEYLRMIEFKTAELLAGSLMLGAIVGNAGDEDARHLHEFGKNIGICFQLLDDLLDAFGEEVTFGKKIGGDIAQNKKTYLYIKALELAEGAERDKLIYYFSNNIPLDEKVKHVTEIYRNVQVERLARAEAQSYNEAAFRNLEAVNVPAERKKELKEFAGMMFSRKV
jgi:geranylgeranyl diphosphate synthase type II